MAGDPNAYDVYVKGTREKVARLPWCSRERAELIAAAPEMQEALREAPDMPAPTASHLEIASFLGAYERWLGLVRDAAIASAEQAGEAR